MPSSDPLGLPFYWQWITGHGWWITFVLNVTLTVVAMAVIARVFENRWLPLNPRRQFVSFFPGDIFLGMMMAGLLVLAQDLPEASRWYNSAPWHGIVQGLVLVVAVKMTYDEWKAGNYPTRAIFSPTKLYHNFVLYAGYGYLIITTLVAVLVGSVWTWQFAGDLALSLFAGFAWIAMLLIDNNRKMPFDTAHIADWRPVWVR